MRTRVIAAQPSWVVENEQVSVAITEIGGHMAPVTFFRGTRRPVAPYYVSPWQGEGLKVAPPVLAPLRGDFFCMPFGADSTWKGDAYTTHGEPASAKWTAAGLDTDGPVTRLTLSMKTRAPAGRVTKRLMLVAGHDAIYQSHVLEDYSTRTPLGHHATLAPPDRPDGLLLSTSPIVFGLVSPGAAVEPVVDGEYRSLQAGARFSSLARVPTIWKDRPTEDCSRYPRRQGFCDIIQVYSRSRSGMAWTVAVAPGEGYLWYSLKDPAVLPSTVLWMENRGRHGSPWNGRNLCIGLEEVCAFFADGLAASVRKNAVSEQGIPTVHRLSPSTPLRINVIHGVARIPRSFGRVKTVRFGHGTARFTDDAGREVTARVNHRFVATGEPAAG